MTGRQKQTIVRGGRNIDINEMEAAIARVPGIVQVCVVRCPMSCWVNEPRHWW